MEFSSEVLQRFRTALTTETGDSDHDRQPRPLRVPSTGGRESAGGVPNVRPCASATWLEGEAEDRTLNVWVRFRVEISAGVVVSVQVGVFGCPHMVAASHWAAEQLNHKPVGQLRHFDVQMARQRLDVPTEKLGKLLRIDEALKACLAGDGGNS